MGLLSFITKTKSFLNFSLIGLLIGVILILIFIKSRKKLFDFFSVQKKLIQFAKSLPGPPSIPLIGSALYFTQTDKTFLIFAKLGRELKANTYKVWFGPGLRFILMDPRDYKILMQSPHASDKDIAYTIMERILGQSLLTSNGLSYRPRKKAFVHVANGVNTLSEYAIEFIAEAKNMVDELEKKVTSEEVDAEHFITRHVASIVFKTLYGVTLNSKNGNSNPYFDYMDKVLYTAIHRAIAMWLWPDAIFNRTNRGKEAVTMMKKIHNFTSSMLAERKEKVLRIINGTEGEKPIFSCLTDEILYFTITSNLWSFEELVTDATMLYVASHDTITGVASFTILMLAMFPEVQQKVRDEIKEVVGDGDITEIAASDLKYLEMVIKETVRLFPVAPILARKVTEDLKLATCTLPKGASVFLVPYATHRDASYWTNPDEFIPERFSPEHSVDRDTWAFVPFSGGIRSCGGTKYGMVCLKILTAHLVQHFQLRTTMTMARMDLRSHVSTRCANGYPVSLMKINR